MTDKPTSRLHRPGSMKLSWILPPIASLCALTAVIPAQAGRPTRAPRREACLLLKHRRANMRDCTPCLRPSCGPCIPLYLPSA